jgi:hypothetical protein
MTRETISISNVHDGIALSPSEAKRLAARLYRLNDRDETVKQVRNILLGRKRDAHLNHLTMRRQAK